MKLTYKCIAGPQAIEINQKGTIEDAARIFENILNQNAVDGWSYDSTFDATTAQKPGCFGGMSGKGNQNTGIKIFVFRKGQD